MTNSNSEFHKMITVSIGHLTKETIQWLTIRSLVNATAHATQVLADVHVAAHGYGFFSYVHDEYDDSYPQDLIAVYEHVRRLGADYVNFDNSGPVLDGLPVYESA